MNRYVKYTVIGLSAIGVSQITLDTFDGVVDEAKQTRTVITVASSASTAVDALMTVARAPNGDEVRVVNRPSYRVAELLDVRST